jgi:hypothetical protein
VEGSLGAWEALQLLLKMVVEDPDALKVWAQVKGQDINPKESGHLIVGDGYVNFLKYK